MDKGTATITVTCSKAGYNSASISFDVKVADKLAMSDDGNITEGAENGELITVTLTNMKLAETLTPASWQLSNLPEGVTRGAVTRVSDTTATVALSGNSTVDYDSDIAVGLLADAAEFVDQTSGFSSNTCPIC
jgi:hypothetical protein